MRQKSRATWIDYGDSNSKYFFAQMKIRASKNTITTVYNDMGMKITDPKAVEKEFISFFTQQNEECQWVNALSKYQHY